MNGFSIKKIIISKWNKNPPIAWYILLTDKGKLLLIFFCQSVAEVTAIKEINTAIIPPNGNDLPIGGFGPTEIIELAIGKINSKLYLSFGKDNTLLGFAVVIKEFDVVGQSIPGANIFLGFDIKGVQGMAGIFSSEQEMQSGQNFVNIGQAKLVMH